MEMLLCHSSHYICSLSSALLEAALSAPWVRDVPVAGTWSADPRACCSQQQCLLVWSQVHAGPLRAQNHFVPAVLPIDI